MEQVQKLKVELKAAEDQRAKDAEVEAERQRKAREAAVARAKSQRQREKEAKAKKKAKENAAKKLAKEKRRAEKRAMKEAKKEAKAKKVASSSSSTSSSSSSSSNSSDSISSLSSISSISSVPSSLSDSQKGGVPSRVKGGLRDSLRKAKRASMSLLVTDVDGDEPLSSSLPKSPRSIHRRMFGTRSSGNLAAADPASEEDDGEEAALAAEAAAAAAEAEALQAYEEDSEAVEDVLRRATAPQLTNAQRDEVVAAIDKTDAALGMALRPVFEGGREDEFLESLQAFAGERRRDIEGMCDANYQEFAASASALVRLRGELGSHRADVAALQLALSTGIRGCIAVRREFEDCGRVLRNMHETRGMVAHALRLVRSVREAGALVESRRYFEALRVLDRVVDAELPAVAALELAAQVGARVPAIRLDIKARVTTEVSDWLVLSRSGSHRLGRAFMSLTAAEMDAQDRVKREVARERARRSAGRTRRRRRRILSNAGSSSKSVATAYQLEERVSGAGEDTFAAFPELRPTPLYRALHVFERLDSREEIEQLYSHARQVHAQTLLNGYAARDGGASFDDELFHRIAGFFILEESVMRARPDLVRSADLHAMWTGAARALRAHMQGVLSKPAVDFELVRSLKAKLLLLARTMRTFGYSVHMLMEFLGQAVCPRVVEVVVRSYAAALDGLFGGGESFTPLVVRSAEEFQELVVHPGLEELWSPSRGVPDQVWSGTAPSWAGVQSPDQVRFPVTAPFSALVPHLVSGVSTRVAVLRDFAAGLQPGAIRDEDSVNRLLLVVVDRLRDVLRDPACGISVLVQLSVDVPVLRAAVQVLRESLGATPDLCLSLAAEEQLAAVPRRLEARLFELVEQKLGQLLQAYVLAAAPVAGSALSQQPPVAQSGAVELAAYAASMAGLFSPLPPDVRTSLGRRTLELIADSLLGMLLQPSLRRITRDGAAVLLADVQHMTAELGDLGDAGSSFRVVDSLLTLLASGAPNELLDAAVRRRKYAALRDSSIVLTLLEKYELPSKSLFSWGTSAKPSDSRKRQSAAHQVVQSLRNGSLSL